MKILLSGANFCDEPYIVYPLGMSVTARILTAAGHEVRQFDPLAAGGLAAYREKLSAAVREFQPDLAGVSIRNLDNIDSRTVDCGLLGRSFELIAALRAAAPGVPLMLGGPGFTLYPEAILKLTGCEYGVAGEGERAVLELAAKIESGTPPPAGTIFRAPVERIAGALYDPAIADFYCGETHMLPVQTKRGCPFKCAYCTYPALEGRTMRPRPLDAVLNDIRFIHERYPEAMIYFVDSVFNDPGRCFEPLVRAMIEQKLQVPWTGFITPGHLRDGDLELLAESGLVTADLGVDAASDAALAGLGKSFTFSEVERCCAKLRELQVGITTSVMFGGPGETYATVREGIANLRRLEPAYSIVFSGIRVLDGAPLVAIARREKQIPDDWNGVGSLYYFAPGLDREIVHEMLLDGFRDSRFCVYPAGSRNHDVRMIHKFGYVKLRNLHLTGNQ